MPLIRNGDWAQDAFAVAADDAPLPGGAVLVTMTRFLAERAALLTRNAPLGVALAPGQSPEILGEDAARLALIVIPFAGFRDGRGFSYARLLRTRLGFAGELRASGAFLVDQLAYLLRVGFDAFDGDARITPQALARARAEISAPYQPAPDGAATIRQLRANR